MIRMRTDLQLAAMPTGAATVPLPIPGQVIATLGLWRRAGPTAGLRTTKQELADTPGISGDTRSQTKDLFSRISEEFSGR
jgi:hypothetical protein